MKPPQIQYSAEDRATLERYKEEIRDSLRKERGGTDQIAVTSERIYSVYASGLWEMEGYEKFDEWLDATFGITGRQGLKYRRIGERLPGDEIVGSGLCLDSLFQVSLSPPDLRPVVRDLGRLERLPPGALSAGRRAGTPLLKTQDLDHAVRACVRAARRRAGVDDSEEDPQAPDKPGPDDPDAAQKKDQAAAERHLKELLAVLNRLAQRGQAADPEWVSSLLDQLDEAQQQAEALRVRSQASQAPDTSTAQGPISEARFHAEAAADPPRQDPSLASLIRFFREDAEIETQVELGATLYFLLRGDPVAEEFPFLSGLYDEMQAQVPRPVFDRWLGLLCGPDRDRGRAFALWFYKKAGLPDYCTNLQLLSQQADLPPGLLAQVREALRPAQTVEYAASVPDG